VQTCCTIISLYCIMHLRRCIYIYIYIYKYNFFRTVICMLLYTLKGFPVSTTYFACCVVRLQLCYHLVRGSKGSIWMRTQIEFIYNIYYTTVYNIAFDRRASFWIRINRETENTGYGADNTPPTTFLYTAAV